MKHSISTIRLLVLTALFAASSLAAINFHAGTFQGFVVGSESSDAGCPYDGWDNDGDGMVDEADEGCEMEVWCCSNPGQDPGWNVEKKPESFCSSAGNFWTYDEESAKSACEPQGWCCHNAEDATSWYVDSGTKSYCTANGGDHWSNDYNATAEQCEPQGWCCRNPGNSDTWNVSASKQTACGNDGGMWYSEQSDAKSVCEPVGWCCMNENDLSLWSVQSLTESSCGNAGGTQWNFDYNQVYGACEPRGFCCDGAGTVNSNTAQSACWNGGGSWYDNTNDATSACTTTVVGTGCEFDGVDNDVNGMTDETGEVCETPADPNDCSRDFADNNNDGNIDETGERCATDPNNCSQDTIDNDINGVIDEAGEQCGSAFTTGIVCDQDNVDNNIDSVIDEPEEPCVFSGISTGANSGTDEWNTWDTWSNNEPETWTVGCDGDGVDNNNNWVTDEPNESCNPEETPAYQPPTTHMAAPESPVPEDMEGLQAENAALRSQIEWMNQEIQRLQNMISDQQGTDGSTSDTSASTNESSIEGDSLDDFRTRLMNFLF